MKLLSLALLAACNSEPEVQPTTSAPRIEASVEAPQLTRSLGARQTLTADRIQNLSFEGMKLDHEGYDQDLSGGDNLKIWVPEFHLDLREITQTPEKAEQHQKQFLLLENLIKTYDIRVMGVEGIAEISYIRRVFVSSGMDLSEFLFYMNQTQIQESGQGFTQDQLTFYRVALDSEMSFEDRRTALQKYIENPLILNYPAQFFIDAIYGDADDFRVVPVDVDKELALQITHFDDLLSREIDEINNGSATQLANIGGTLHDVRIDIAFDLATKKKDPAAQVVYCTYWNGYREMVDNWAATVHGLRNPIVANKVLALDEPGIFVFGGYHTNPVVEMVSSENPVSVVYPDTHDRSQFAPEHPIQDRYQVLPDLNVIEGNPSCAEVLKK